MVEYIVAIAVTRVRFPADAKNDASFGSNKEKERRCIALICAIISGLVVEYIVAIDVTRA